MKSLSDLKSGLSGQDQEDANLLDGALEQIIRVLKDRKLAKLMQYKIIKRGTTSKGHLSILGRYTGPDIGTQRMLDQNAKTWSDDPQKFWDKKSVQWPDLPDLQAQIIVLLEMSRQHGLDQLEDSVRLLCGLGLPMFDRDRVNKTKADMLDAGSRYQHLEKILGSGIYLVLGVSVLESKWTKELGKSGKDFKLAMELVKKTSAIGLAQQYNNLCQTLIHYQINKFQSSKTGYIPPTAEMLSSESVVSPSHGTVQGWKESITTEDFFNSIESNQSCRCFAKEFCTCSLDVGFGLQ